MDVSESTFLNSFAVPTMPVSFGTPYTFPEDITRLGPTEIGQLMSMLGAFRGYATVMRCVCERERNQADKNYKETLSRAKSLVENSSAYTQTVLKEKASEHPTVVKVNDVWYKANQNYIFYSALIEVYTGQIEILSRELSRRQMLGEKQ